MKKRVLVACRGSMAIQILLKAKDLEWHTVTVFSAHNRHALYRYKADEAYEITQDERDFDCNIEIESLIQIAKNCRADVIHPGDSHLNRWPQMARRCAEEGIEFMGQCCDTLTLLQDVLTLNALMNQLSIPASKKYPISYHTWTDVLAATDEMTYPFWLKSCDEILCHLIYNEADLKQAWLELRQENQGASKSQIVYLESYFENSRRLEVPLLADAKGEIVFFPVCDITLQHKGQLKLAASPAIGLSAAMIEQLNNMLVAMISAINVRYAASAMFILDKDGGIHFSELRPRLSSEYALSELISEVDILRCQLLISEGMALTEIDSNFPLKRIEKPTSCAMQVVLSAEIPEQDFLPDYGRMTSFRKGAGEGLRFDESGICLGMVLSLKEHSEISRITAFGKSHHSAVHRLSHALKETQILGLQTNNVFLQKILQSDLLLKGQFDVDFLQKNPELLLTDVAGNSLIKNLKYLAEIKVNGHPDVTLVQDNKRVLAAHIPNYNALDAFPLGHKDNIRALGRSGFLQWIKQEKQVLLTDTTWHSAQQALLLTRLRTTDILAVAEGYARLLPEMFAIEIFGNGSFDVALSFLNENPWMRLEQVREAMPNMLLQMRLGAENLLGYAPYSEKLIHEFINLAWQKGIDLFRVYDAFNRVEAMLPVIRQINEKTDALVAVELAYVGDVLQEKNPYNLQYYLDLAQQMEEVGAHFIAINDYAGLLKPEEASVLISALKEQISLPIVLHTVETKGLQSAVCLAAIHAGVDILDVAFAAFSGTNTPPGLSAACRLVEGSKRKVCLNSDKINELNTYWENVRDWYYPFEKGAKSPINNEAIPGLQYAHLQDQSERMGCDTKFFEVKDNYRKLSKLFGLMPKQMPVSKAIGDMAVYMTSACLSIDDILLGKIKTTFPTSFLFLIQGCFGNPQTGFSEAIQQLALKSKTTLIQPAISEHEWKQSMILFYRQYPSASFSDFILAQLFPKAYEQYVAHFKQFDDTSVLRTSVFYFGLKDKEEIVLAVDKGRSAAVQIIAISEMNSKGYRNVTFEANGYFQNLMIQDKSFFIVKEERLKVTDYEKQYAAPFPGHIAVVLVKEGDVVQSGTPLFVVEALKMSTTVLAHKEGIVKKVCLFSETNVFAHDLILEMV